MPPLPPQVSAASSSFIDFQVKAKRHYKSREWDVTYRLLGYATCDYQVIFSEYV
jgi:hypothetical protein